MSKNYKQSLIIGVLLILLGVAFSIYNELKNNDMRQELARPTIKLADEIISVDIADTPQMRQKGLSGREALADNEGMFFIFERAEKHSFWMKDMNFSIDIVWINDAYTIVDITENLHPESYPKTYRPSIPVRYVLELPSGWIERNKVNMGDMVTINLLDK
jgi:uncharacterized membrane protein (UPF0127 family)